MPPFTPQPYKGPYKKAKPKAVPKNKPKNPPRNKNPRPKGNKPSQPTFNPTRMAQTLTDLGYDSQIAEIERALDENARMEAVALSNLSDWSRQIEDFRAAAAPQVQQAWQSAVQGAEASNQNIANLFGENAAGEAAAGMAPGVDMLRALGAGDSAFMQYMQPILAAQGLDYSRRAMGEFGAERRELTGSLRDARSEKADAYGKNLLDMMQLGWGREQQVFDQRMARLQAQQAQQAIDQAKAMFGPQLEAQQLENLQTRTAIQLAQENASLDREMTKLEQQQLRIANRKAQVELQRLQQQGVDPLDPQARAQIAGAALSGVVNENRVLMMNPRLALKSALDILASMGLENDPAAVTAVLKQFEVLLRFSHSRGAWKKWRMKNGQLIYAPAKPRSTKLKEGPGKGLRFNPNAELP